MDAFVNYHVIKFGKDDVGFWNIPEWHKNRESAIESYRNSYETAECDGAVLIISNYYKWEIANHYGADDCTVIPDDYNIFRVERNEVLEKQRECAN
jgi:hypothetical protein